MGDAVSNWAQVPVDHLPKPSASNFTRYYDAKMFLPPCRVHVEELVEPRNCIFHCGGNDFPWFGRHRVASFPVIVQLPLYRSNQALDIFKITLDIWKVMKYAGVDECEG